MSILHIVRRSAFETNDFLQCIDMLQSTDTLVFTDDGCYNLNHALLTKAQTRLADKAIHSISSHCQARAISSADINLIEMSTLVALCFSSKATLTWQ
jgi:tRNA 2-thiouridine synthesizing protein B